VPRHFTGNFTQQEPIPEEAIARAVEVMRSGRLHRYNVAAGETDETALLEVDFAKYVGAKYCLAVASGGYAMQMALRAFGLKAGEQVLTNAFTLSPVPGAIAAAGGQPVFVETTADLVIDLDDLQRKAASSKPRLLLLSHMRGHIADMDRLMSLAQKLELSAIEDCAHTMGAAWKGIPTGRHGLAGCYSTQTYKHINSGEGGFLVSDDPKFMARAVILSGSYMLYRRHLAGPAPEHYRDIKLDTPNCSGRMDNLRAAILRPQLKRLDENRERWNLLYRTVENALRDVAGLALRRRPQEETFVGSSIQFRVVGLRPDRIPDFLARCKSSGVELKWFGASEPVAYTSKHDSWRYAGAQSMPQTDEVLSTLCDMRLPLTFSKQNCEIVGEIIRETYLDAKAAQERGEAPSAIPLATIGAA
jgi:dTDP-4-amino-4,6-dideoxygalactose transaminase